MNKDTVIASFIGFGLGLIAAITLWVVPRILPKNPQTQPTIQQETTSNEQENKSKIFEISAPMDGSISESDTIKVSGSALGAQLIVIATATKNVVITPDASGNFSEDIGISEGGNNITITQYNETDYETKHLYIYYYPESI